MKNPRRIVHSYKKKAVAKPPLRVLQEAEVERRLHGTPLPDWRKTVHTGYADPSPAALEAREHMARAERLLREQQAPSA